MRPAAPDTGVVVDVRGLLTIDVDAELRKLATAQLQGPWQIPAELVRRALAAGAARVAVDFGRHRAVIRDDGGAIAEPLLRALAELLDPRAPSHARHDALLALEAAGALALLALAGLALEHLEISSDEPGRPGLVLVGRAGQRPRLEHRALARERRTTVVLRGAELDAGRARTALSEAARFAQARIEIDGRALGDPLVGYLASAPCSFELARGGVVRGRVALPHERGQARLWLLQHGLVVTHQALAQVPAFEAVLELGDALGVRATPADLREAIAPLLGSLADAAVGLMLAAVPRLPEWPQRARAQLLALLLEAARLGRQRRAVEAAAIVPVALAGGGAELRSLAELAAQGERGPGGQPVLLALDPEQPLGDVILTGAPVAILDAAACSTITEVYGLRFRPPPRRIDPRSPVARALVGVAAGALDLVGAVAGALRLGVGAPVDADALDADERELLAHLRAIVPQSGPGAPTEVVLCAGRGRPRRTRVRGGRLLLPRGSPEVRSAVAVLRRRGPAWLYPAAIALLGGRDVPPVGVRTTWLREWTKPPPGR